MVLDSPQELSFMSGFWYKVKMDIQFNINVLKFKEINY
jgi:hypothetical protein